jgi:hypothetical protein
MSAPGTLPRWGSRVRVPSSAPEKLLVRGGASRPYVMTGPSCELRGPVGIPFAPDFVTGWLRTKRAAAVKAGDAEAVPGSTSLPPVRRWKGNVPCE